MAPKPFEIVGENSQGHCENRTTRHKEKTYCYTGLILQEPEMECWYRAAPDGLPCSGAFGFRHIGGRIVDQGHVCATVLAAGELARILHQDGRKKE